MKTKRLATFCGMMTAVFLSAPVAQGALVLPQARAVIDNEVIDLGAGFVPGSSHDVYFGQAPGQSSLFNQRGAAVRLQGAADIDPFVIFALSVTDSDVPSTFDFVFVVPVSPVFTGNVQVHSTLGITLTSPQGITSSIAPDLFPTIMISNIGACAAGVDIGDGYSSPPQSSTVRSFDATGVVPASVGCDSSLIVEVSFQGSGSGAQYGLTGLFEATAIPEPGSLVILSVGAGWVMLGRGRRRGKNQAVR